MKKNRILFLVAVFCLVVSSFVVAEESRYSDIALLKLGSVDSEVFERVKSYVEEQYLVKVRLCDSIKDIPVKPEELEKLVVSQIKPTDICLLAVASLPKTDKQGILYKKDRCGLINVAALVPTIEVEGIPGGLKEVFERRVEKESLRGIAIMVGVPACPSLRCALYNAKGGKELDLKSRNPCPPCLEKIRNKLSENGLEIREKKPAVK